jgi:hypothetical protein
MTSAESLRHVTEDDASMALASIRSSLPITDSATLARAVGRMLGGPVTDADVAETLDAPHLTLPVTSPADLVRFYNRLLDLRFGEEYERAADIRLPRDAYNLDWPSGRISEL